MGGASGTTTTKKKTKSTSNNANNTSSTSLVPATILQRFWDLASTDAETRCTAAASLSEELFLVQNNTTSSITNDDDKNNVKLDAVVEYSMKRLTRGLGSGRAGARQGFAVAFTSAMTHLDAISVEDGFRFLKEGLEPITKSTKGSEARDILIGQLFGNAALARALVAKEVSLEAKKKKKEMMSGSGSSNNNNKRKKWTTPEEERERIVDLSSQLFAEICRISNTKAYLSESAAKVMIELALSLSKQEEGLHEKDPFRLAREALEKCPQAQAWVSRDVTDVGEQSGKTTIETVWLAYSLYECLPARCKEAQSVVPKFSSSSSSAKEDSFFAYENLKKVSHALAECPHAHPRVHPIWEILCEACRSNSDDDKKGGNKAGATTKISAGSNLTRLEALWETCCENGLFTAPSHQRKYLGFRIFSMLLRNATASETAKLFTSPNFIKCLVSNCAKPENYLHACSTDCLKAIARCAKHSETSAKKRVAIVAALRKVGIHRFEKQLAKSSGISTLLAGLTREEAKAYCEELRETILEKSDLATQDESDDENENDDNDEEKKKKSSRDFKRLWALEQMCSITSALSPNDRLDVLHFCLFHAFYSTSKKQLPKTVLGKNIEDCPDVLRRALSTRLLGILLTNIRSRGRTQQQKKQQSQNTKNGKNHKDKGNEANEEDEEEEEKFDALSEACEAVLKFDADASVTDVIPNSARAKEARKNLANALKLCEKKQKADESGVATSIIPLLKTLIVLHASDPKQFTSIVEDIPRCVEELLQPPKKKKTTKKKSTKKTLEEDEEEEHDLEPMDVLNDLLIAFLAQPSALLRDVTERTFKGVSGKITDRGIEDILNVVENMGAGKRGDENDDENDDEDDDSDDEDMLEEEDDSDDDDDDDDSSSSDDDSDEDDDENDSDAGMDTEANEGAIEAIRKAALKIQEDDDNSDDSDSDDFTDEQMFATDKLLADAFRAKRQELSRKKALKVAAADFKFRALSLLELFAKSQPSSKFLPEIIVPRLLSASRNARIRFKSNPMEKSFLELAQRIDSVLTKHACKHAAMVTGTRKDIHEILTQLIDVADNGAGAGRDSDAAKGFAKTAAVACAYIAKVMESNGDGESAAEIYKTAITEKFEKKTSRLRAPFFAELIKLSPNVLASSSKELASLCDLGDSARAQFLRQESLQLLFQIFSCKQRDSSIPSAEEVNSMCEISLANAVKADVENQSRRADTSKMCANVFEAIGRHAEGFVFSQKAKAAIENAIETQKERAPQPSQKTVQALERIAKALDDAKKTNSSTNDEGKKKRKSSIAGDDDHDEREKKKKKKKALKK